MLETIKKNKNDLLIILCLLALSTVILMSITLGTDNLHKDLASSRYTGYKGTKAFYLVCDRLGYNIDRLDRFEKLSESDNVLFIISPKYKIDSNHIKLLEKWVSSGNTLICDEKILSIDKIKSYSNNSNKFPLDHDNILAQDVKKVYWKTTDFFNRVEIEDTYRVLYHIYGKAKIVERTVGDGRIIRIKSPDFFTNQFLNEKDNSILAINLVHYALGNSKSGNILFDESHYQQNKDEHSTSYTLLGDMLFHTPWGWFVVTLFIAGMCFIWMKGKRFGPVRQLPGQRRRAKLEYVHSAGACWSNARAYSIMFELNYKWLRESIADKIGISAKVDNKTFANEIARRTENESVNYQDVLDRADYAVNSSMSKRELKNLINELGKIELELSDG